MRVSALIASALMAATSVQSYSIKVSSETKGAGALFVNGNKVTDLFNTGQVDSTLTLGGGRHVVAYSLIDNDADGVAGFATQVASGSTTLGRSATKFLTGDAPAGFSDFGYDDSAWSSTGLTQCAYNNKFFWPTSCTTGSGPQKVNARYTFDLDPLVVTYNNADLGKANSGPVPITIALASKPACNVQVEIQHPTDTTQLSACTLTFTPDNWNVGQTVQLTIKHWATPNTATVNLPLDFKTTASSTSSACYADMPLHCFKQCVTLQKQYDTGAVGSCTSWGDPHLIDFEGTSFDFMGSHGEQYYLVDTPELTVQARVRHVHSGITVNDGFGVRYLNYLAFYSSETAGTWRVFGNPPANTFAIAGTKLDIAGGSGAGGVTFDVSGSSAVNLNSLKVSPKFFGRTRGLCGNFNRIANELATSANNFNGDAYVVNGVTLRDKWASGSYVTRYISNANAGPLYVPPEKRYIVTNFLTSYQSGVSSVADVANFNTLCTQGICPALSNTCPAGPQKPIQSTPTPTNPNNCVGDCGEVVNPPPAGQTTSTMTEYFTSTATDQYGAPTVIVGTNVVVKVVSAGGLGNNPSNDPDLSGAFAAAGAVGAVAVIGMGAFLLRRRRQMIQETADTMYSVQSVIANSQGNVGNQFLENPIYENDIRSSGDGLQWSSDADNLSVVASVHQLATQMSGVSGMDNGSIRGASKAPSVRSAQFTRE